MFALLLLIYKNKEQQAFKFKYPGQVTPAAQKRPSYEVNEVFWEAVGCIHLGSGYGNL